MAAQRRTLCFKRLDCLSLFLLLLLAHCTIATTAGDQQPPQETTAADSRSCSREDLQAASCNLEKQQGSEQQPAAAKSPPPARSLQEQMHAQQRMLSVLRSITAGTITADAALTLLQDAAVLRESLAHGAAARRWAKLKARAAHGSRNTTQQLLQQPPPQQRQQQQGKEEDSSRIATQLSAQPQQQGVLSRGILIVAGGRHQFLNAHILLRLLRYPTIGCSLPAELVYYGPHEFDAPTAKLIEAHAAQTHTHVEIIDGYEVAPPAELEPHRPIVHLTGFKTKVHALAFVTSFEQVLLLDSDNTPLADPTYLFDAAAFAASGNLQWPDFWTNQWMQPVLYSLLGLDVPWEVNPRFRASEAGQLLLDRVQHYDVLEWLWLLNTHSSSGVAGARESGVVGKCIWGDKDTYPIAFQLAGKGSVVAYVPHYPLQALSRQGGRGAYMHAGMLQRGLHGELLFLHRTAAGKLWPHCAWHGGEGCKVWGVTAPVDQEQLVASVRDVSAMQLEPDKVDLAWQEQHCKLDGGASSGGDGIGDGDGVEDSSSREEGAGGGQRCEAAAAADGAAAVGTVKQQQHQHGKATMLACDLDESVGLLPIPVIAVERLPPQVQQVLHVTHATFLETVQPVSVDESAEYQQAFDDDSDPYY